MDTYSNDICKKHGIYCDKKCDDPNIDNGMMTKVWGPAGWFFLHSIAYGYPYAINLSNPDHATKREDYYKFFYYLGRVFPCKYCRESYQQFMTTNSLINKLQTRRDLCKWLYDIHNMVNDKLNVSSDNIPTFEDIEKRYENYRAKCTSNINDTTNSSNLSSVESLHKLLPYNTNNNNNNNNIKKINKCSETEEGFAEEFNRESREKQQNIKGCIVPANGKSCKTIIKIIESHRDENDNTNDNYVTIHKKYIYISISLFIILLIFICYITYKYYFTKKYK